MQRPARFRAPDDFQTHPPFGVVAGCDLVSFDAGLAGEGCLFSGVDRMVWGRDERGTMETSCR